MRKLGFAGFGRSTVQRILKRHGLWPRPSRSGPRWHDFLGHYAPFIWACDFLTVTTAALRTYYVLFFIEISSRRIVLWNVSDSPDGAWAAQQFRNLSLPTAPQTDHRVSRTKAFAPTSWWFSVQMGFSGGTGR